MSNAACGLSVGKTSMRELKFIFFLSSKHCPHLVDHGHGHVRAVALCHHVEGVVDDVCNGAAIRGIEVDNTIGFEGELEGNDDSSLGVRGGHAGRRIGIQLHDLVLQYLEPAKIGEVLRHEDRAGGCTAGEQVLTLRLGTVGLTVLVHHDADERLLVESCQGSSWRDLDSPCDANLLDKDLTALAISNVIALDGLEEREESEWVNLSACPAGTRGWDSKTGPVSVKVVVVGCDLPSWAAIDVTNSPVDCHSWGSSWLFVTLSQRSVGDDDGVG